MCPTVSSGCGAGRLEAPRPLSTLLPPQPPLPPRSAQVTHPHRAAGRGEEGGGAGQAGPPVALRGGHHAGRVGKKGSLNPRFLYLTSS